MLVLAVATEERLQLGQRHAGPFREVVEHETEVEGLSDVLFERDRELRLLRLDTDRTRWRDAARIAQLETALEDARAYTEAEFEAVRDAETSTLARLLLDLPGPEHSVEALSIELARLRRIEEAAKAVLRSYGNAEVAVIRCRA